MKKNSPTDSSLPEPRTSGTGTKPDAPIGLEVSTASNPDPETDAGVLTGDPAVQPDNSRTQGEQPELAGTFDSADIFEADTPTGSNEVNKYEPAAPDPEDANADVISEDGEPQATPYDDQANPVLHRVRAPHATWIDNAKSSVLSFIKNDLPSGMKRLGPMLSAGATSFLLFIKGLFSKKARSIRRRKKKSRNTIRQTDRERVYKLRGYTTYEKVIAKRKAQRRFRIAQRITITLMCVGLLGYMAFRNNPFTDIDEMLRIIGIRNSVAIPFHQYDFPLVLIEPDSGNGGEGDETEETESPPELTTENDFAQLVKENGREVDRFYVLAYEGAVPLQEDLENCRLTVAASDFAQLTTNRKVGTILVLLPKQGDVSTYRFTDVRQSGVIVDISALPITTTGGASRVYMIGLLSDKPYHGYSFDVTTQAPTQKITAP